MIKMKKYVPFLIFVMAVLVLFSSCDEETRTLSELEIPSVETSSTELISENESNSEEESDTTNDSHDHLWSEWEMVHEPDCEAYGIEQRSCECGTEETHIIDALGHGYLSTAMVEPTCSEEGSITYACPCGDTYTEDIDPTLHIYSDSNTCDVCGTVAGLYDAEDKLIASWDDLINNYNVDVEADQDIYSNYKWWENDDLSQGVRLVIGNINVIGANAFAWCEFTTIEIPNGVTVIEKNAFEACLKLKEIYIPKSVVRIGKAAFANCSAITRITVPSSVTKLEGGAFLGCKELKKVVISEGLNSIGANAFSDCSGLTEINIPSSVKKIEEFAFDDCTGLEKITVANGNDIYRGENNCLIEKETNTLILGCKNSVIPDGIEIIGTYAFSECELEELTIPDSVKRIEEYAFLLCQNLEGDIVIPDGVTRLRMSAFAYCSKITSVTLPESLVIIDQYAFTSAKSLETIIFKGTKSQWEEISVGYQWNFEVPAKKVICSDGELELTQKLDGETTVDAY